MGRRAVVVLQGGSLEYIGEAYLMGGNLAKAEDHLRLLDRLGQSPCEGQDDLRKIADYKARRRTSGPPR
jgi:hypothetical protein